MAGRRSNPTAFWDDEATGVNTASAVVQVGEGIEMLLLNLTVSAAATISVECALDPPVNSEGIRPDFDPLTATWGPLFYLGTAISHVFSSGGTAMLIVPDFTPLHLRLKSSANVTATAGYEAKGDF